MTLKIIPPHPLPPPGESCKYIEADPDEGCYWCCVACNCDTHRCPGCGADLSHAGNELREIIRGDDAEVKKIWAAHEGCLD